MRILSLGWEIEAPGLEKASIQDAESLGSYDLVLIDPLRIPDLWIPFVPPGPDGMRRVLSGRDQGLSRALDNLFSLRREELSGLLRVGGLLVVRVRHPGEPLLVASPDGLERRFDAYSFLPSFSLTRERQFLSFPTGVRIVPRRGRDIGGLDETHPLAEYLAALTSYEAVITSPIGLPLEGFGRVLARNRIGDVLAWEIAVGPGRLILLPAPGLAPANEGRLLLPGLLQLSDLALGEPRPDWLERYSLPGEGELLEELRGLEEEERRLRERRSAVLGELRQYEELKGLLFPRGLRGLRLAAGRAFRRLGFEVEEDPQGFLILRSPEGEGLAWAAWSPEGPVGVGAYRPLLLKCDRLRIDEGIPAHGILVAAGEVARDPRRRGPRFTPSLRRACEEHGFALVPAEELFRAVRESLSGHEPKGIRESLLGTRGIWRWKP